eukprot:Opistho-1_new@97928
MMLAKEDEVDAEVNWEDQQKINMFGRLNNRKDEVADELEARKKERDNVKDAADELSLLEGDQDIVSFKLGEVFVHVSNEKAQELLNEKVAKLDEEVERLTNEVESINSTMKQLKVSLYAKFGKSINLEA